MRILHVTERFGPSAVGGAQRSVAYLANSHLAAGHEVKVICLSDDTESPPPRHSALCVQYVPISRVSKLLRQPRLNPLLAAACYFYEGGIRACDPQIEQAIDQFSPDIINTHILTGIPETVWQLGAQKKIPTVHTIRDYFITCARSSMFKRGTTCSSPCPECRFFTMRRRRLLGCVSGIIGISQRLMDIHRANSAFASDQLTCVIPNAVDFKTRVTAERRVDAPFVVGFLGRLVQTKGVENLIRAFRQAAVPAAKLKIAGDGVASYVEHLKKLAVGAPIEFVGKVEAEPFYQQCSLIAIPSLWEEPFGRVVAEALLMGVPVICSDRGSFPEILKQFPGGLATDPENIERFAADLRTMHTARNLYEAFLDTHKDRIARHFSSESIAQQYLDFYENFVPARRRA